VSDLEIDDYGCLKIPSSDEMRRDLEERVAKRLRPPASLRAYFAEHGEPDPVRIRVVAEVGAIPNEQVRKILESIELRRYTGSIESIDATFERHGSLRIELKYFAHERDSGFVTTITMVQVYAVACLPVVPAALTEYLARSILTMCRSAATHEIDECMTVDGVRMFDPHAKTNRSVMTIIDDPLKDSP
jgi:hypothetical protein